MGNSTEQCLGNTLEIYKKHGILLLLPSEQRAEHGTGADFQLLLPFGDPRRSDVVFTSRPGPHLVTVVFAIATFSFKSKCKCLFCLYP